MRIWSIHPSYLDAKGLVALWRETLLAQKVLAGGTSGYKHHPQLHRFRETPHPVAAIAAYLTDVAAEADRRGYNFDKTKIRSDNSPTIISVTTGQVDYEFAHLLKKLKVRAPEKYDQLKNVTDVDLHPLFRTIPGDIESWEII